jgi:hypothetical protein
MYPDPEHCQELEYLEERRLPSSLEVKIKISSAIKKKQFPCIKFCILCLVPIQILFSYVKLIQSA